MGINKKVIGWVASGIITLLVLITILLSSTRVLPGYNGVQYSLVSGMKEEVFEEGLQWHAPWIKVYEYPVSTETVELRNPRKDEDREDDSLQVNTGDAKSVRVDVRYYYKMKAEMLPHIFKRFRRQDASWVADNFIKAEILNAVQNVTTKHSVLEIYSQNREQIATEIRDTLRESLAKDGIILEQFTFSDVRPDKETSAILQQIADEENKKEVLIREERTLAQEKNNIEQQKNNEELSAERDKDIALINADKKAMEIKIQAEAQAEANKKLAESLTPILIQSQWNEKWDGVVSIVGGDNGANIVNLPQEVFEKEEAKDN